LGAYRREGLKYIQGLLSRQKKEGRFLRVVYSRRACAKILTNRQKKISVGDKFRD
jgi:hypothetical protein